MVPKDTQESEYLDFKSGLIATKDQDVKKLWCKALSGYGNTEGGLLIFGIRAERTSIPGEKREINTTDAVEPVVKPKSLAQLLSDTVLNAVQPPLGGVEIRTVIESSGEGFVVCLIPAGADGPYLDKNEGYYRMRVSDNFVVIPHDILRRMFFPRTSPSLSIRLKARAHNERFNPIEFIAHIKNTGSASARDLFVVVWTNLVYSNYSGTTAFRYIQDEDHLGTAETLQLLHPHREAAFLIAEWDFDLVRSKPTASGRATRRASSDPAYS